MSSTSAPFGFQPVYHASGFVRPAAFTLANNAAVTLLLNQPVKISTDGVVVPATVGDPFVGTFQGVEFTDGDGRRRVSNKFLANTPAMPPAVRTVPIQACCAGVRWPVVVFTSMLVKTAICCPTISGVMVTVRQPIRSAEPRARPNCTGRPVRGSGRVPVLLRNRRRSDRVPSARRMRCWISVSAFGTRVIDPVRPAGTVAAFIG